jgi:hypothetical protein
MQRTGKYYWLTVSCTVLMVGGIIIIFLCSGTVFDYPPGLINGL